MNELFDIEQKLKAGWGSDIGSQQDYLFELSITKARINELRNEAEKFYNQKLSQFIGSGDFAKMKQYEYKDKRDVFCRNESEHLNRLDRISGTIETQTKSLITIISYTKAEMQNIS